MRRLIGLWVAVVVVTALSGGARADRVVAPLDALEAGNVDASIELQGLRSSLHVKLGSLEADGTDMRSGASLRGGFWIVDHARLGLTLPISLTASTTMNDMDLPVEDETGIGDLGVEASDRWDFGKLQLGLQTHLQLPTGQEHHSSDSTDVQIEVPVGYRIGDRARAFGVAMYELVGLSGDDDPDSAGLSLGGDFRDDALSLVATAFYRRSFNDPEAVDTVGLIATAGYELVPGLTAGASAGYVYLLETERPGGAIVSATGITAGLTLQYVARVR